MLWVINDSFIQLLDALQDPTKQSRLRESLRNTSDSSIRQTVAAPVTVPKPFNLTKPKYETSLIFTLFSLLLDNIAYSYDHEFTFMKLSQISFFVGCSIALI